MSKVAGIGVDMVEIKRVEKLLQDDRFLRRYFSPEEQTYIQSKNAVSAQTMAGIFAAKEAFCKAVGTGITLPLREIAITHSPTGQPCYHLEGEAFARYGHLNRHLSIAHDGGCAIAFCLLEG